MQRFKNILLVIDHRTESKAALDQAVALCKRNQARLAVVDLVEDLSRDAELWLTPDTLSALRSQELETRSKHLNNLTQPIREQGINVRTKTLLGVPFLEIIRQVLRHKHDLVIMTADGDGGLKERLFGSTSMHLMRKCPCPVWVVKPDQPLHYTRILAAVDPASYDHPKPLLDFKIMDLAKSLAELEQAKLHIVHAWLMPGENSLLGGRAQIPEQDAQKFIRYVERKHQSQLNELLLRYNLQEIKYKIHLLKGPATQLIPQVAQEQNIDLIIMGTVARTGISGFFIGNTAESVLNKVDSSVLTVKPDGFVSPVKQDE